ncbi:hypothetical protein [Teredinibacter turnerae]|uniref:hypothetical protein n=1 Tax=Teredinibacter turnerae TaxID=2426 RepID=UPI00036C046B|nr:hypothetical protein [Teredinibacter turnerae]
MKDHEYSEAEFKSARVPVNFVPAYLAGKRGLCEQCRKFFNLDWLEKKWLKTNLAAPNTSLYLKRQGMYFYCPTCKCPFEWKIRMVKPKAQYIFYGDEAYRDTKDNYKVVAYGFIGINSVHKQKLVKLLYDVKRAILPRQNPDSWLLHFAQILNPNKKNKSDRNLTR